MKISLNGTPLKTFEGEDIQDETGKPITLRTACVRALLYTAPNDTTDGQKKFERYKLAEKIMGAKGHVELTAEELALIKQLVGVIYVTVLVGRIYEALEKA